MKQDFKSERHFGLYAADKTRKQAYIAPAPRRAKRDRSGWVLLAAAVIVAVVAAVLW